MVDEPAEVPRPDGLPTRYRLVAPLGRGGSATAHLARDTLRGRDVVVKVLDRCAVADDRLESEVRSLGRLRGLPGVVRLEAAGRTSTGAPWLVEELAPGGSLVERLRAGPLTPAEVVRLVADVAPTLAAAHRLGVAHGDVAPGNLVLDAAGRLLLCDFGVAALAEVAPEGPSAVTPSFAAPERRAGAPPSPPADVYGLAVVAHVAGTGRLPGTAGADGEDLLPGLPVRLARLLARARAADPTRRPTARHLARAARRRTLRWGPGRVGE